jgi:hypothetical protein
MMMNRQMTEPMPKGKRQPRFVGTISSSKKTSEAVAPIAAPVRAPPAHCQNAQGREVEIGSRKKREGLKALPIQ